MCTFSLRRAPSGRDYALLFNRDEKHGRAPEIRPKLAFSARGVPYLAPSDPKGGGTWILANQAGLAACVMNDYPAEASHTPGATRASARLSRGCLPLAVASATSPVEALQELRALIRDAGGPDRWAPFFLFVFAPGAEALCLHWNGERLSETPAGGFHTTSSFEAERVTRARRAACDELARGGPTLEQLREFHWEHHQDAPAASIRMWRPDACTRSVTEVLVEGHSVTMNHRPVDWWAPAGRGPITEIRL
jgi:hypothetical protein